MAKLLLAATTSAANSDSFYVTKVCRGKTICASGLVSAETAVLQFKDALGAWIPMGTAFTLTATAPVLTVTGEGDYRLAKSATVGATSLSVSG